MNTSTIINGPAQFKNICRACRKINRDMRPIFNSEINSVQVSQMLSFAVAINVRPDDKLPKALCSPCLKKLIDTYQFLQMCIESDEEMRNILKNNFNVKSVIVEKIHNHQQHQNLLPFAAKPLLKTALLKNNEFGKIETPVQSQDNDNNTHIDVIEYDGTLIKFENQDYDEFDNFEYGGTSDNRIVETLKMRNRNENMSRVTNKNQDIIYSADTRIGYTNLKCNFCEKQFIRRDDLDNHEIIHTSIKNNSTYIQKSSEYSDKTITIKDRFSLPSTNEPIIGKFSCAFCKNTFHTWENLAKHIGEHKIKSIYGTDPGNPIAVNKTIPMDIEKSSITPHQCTYCLKRFTYREDLICHMNDHINEINITKHLENSSDQIIQLETIREIPIDIENEQPRLSENESNETDSKFYCQFCSSSYTMKSSLQKHVRLKHKKNISNLEKYQCSYCGRLFVKYLDMIRHRKIHKNSNISKNTDPSSAENDKEPLVANDKPSYVCQYCDAKISYTYNLKRHIARKHPESLSNEIVRKLASNSETKTNINVLNSNSKIKNYKCNHCGKLFKKYLDMIRHRKTVHTIIKIKVAKTYQCPHCPSIIKWSINNLDRHIKSVHPHVSNSKSDHIPTPDKQFIKCQYCELTLCSKADVQRHIIKMHKEFASIGLKKYECKYCGKMFKKYFDMCGHQNHHKTRNDPILTPADHKTSTVTTVTNNFEIIEEIPQIESSVIDEGAIDPLEINKANKKHIPVQCNICPVVLRNIYSYNRHIKQVHGLNENESIKNNTGIKSAEVIAWFNCKLCVKRFKTPNALNTHFLLNHSSYSSEIASSESPQNIKKEKSKFNCDQCEKSYERSSGLTRHKKQNHNYVKHINSAALYQCKICEKTFISRKGYIYHDRVHKQKEEDLRRQCILCKKIFKHTIACRRHYRSVHSDKINEYDNAQREDHKYKCSDCYKTFGRSYNYKNHTQRHLVFDLDSSKIVQVKSEKINEKSVKKEIRYEEKLNKKSNKRKLRCIRCPIVFADKEKYSKHVQTHKLKMKRIKHQQELYKKKMREISYKCNICGKIISLLSNFNSHVAAHERRKIKTEEMESRNLIKVEVENHDNKSKNIDDANIISSIINNVQELRSLLETSNTVENNATEQLIQTDVPEQKN